MGTPLDANGLPSLTQRRQATQHLPAFELPPPSQFSTPYPHKFPPLSGINAQPMPTAVSVGNLLTPPPNSGSESSGPSTGPIQTQSMPVLPYTPTTFWQGAGNTPNGFAGVPQQSWHQSAGYPRSMYSPITNSIPRHELTSPSSGSASHLPPPPFELSGIQPFAHSVPLPSPGPGGNQSGQHLLGNHMLGNHARPQSQASPLSPGDGVTRSSSQPGLVATMTASATPQAPFGFQNSTPVSQSPHSVSAPASTTSPPMQPGPIPQLQTQPSPFHRPPYPSYSLPAMPGPVLTNLNAPGSHMSVVGSMQGQMLPIHIHSGYAANPQLHYAQARANSPQQAANQDRPFKCDECPQSFNRNHDLKRHKRIHLAVKPFPCAHCDKSFSRKDALKRHILVKGCGKAGESDSNANDGVKSESGSETNNAMS